MLGKLLKYEMRSISKIMLIIFGAVILLGLIVALGLSPLKSGNPGNSTGSFLAFLGLALYLMVLMGCLFAAYIIISIRFYKNMFTDEGYLTHTLPVKPGTLLVSHILNGFIWSMLALILCLAMVVLIFAFAAPADTLSDFFQTIQQTYHTTTPMIILYILQYCVVGSLSWVTLVYLAICIGNLFIPHKVLASVVACLILYIFEQIVASLLMLVTPSYREMLFSAATAAAPYPPAGFINMMLMMELFSVIMIVLSWIASHIIISKHLNLE